MQRLVLEQDFRYLRVNEVYVVLVGTNNLWGGMDPAQIFKMQFLAGIKFGPVPASAWLRYG